jgi:hypothetical protein
MALFGLWMKLTSVWLKLIMIVVRLFDGSFLAEALNDSPLFLSSFVRKFEVYRFESLKLYNF